MVADHTPTPTRIFPGYALTVSPLASFLLALPIAHCHCWSGLQLMSTRYVFSVLLGLGGPVALHPSGLAYFGSLGFPALLFLLLLALLWPHISLARAAACGRLQAAADNCGWLWTAVDGCGRQQAAADGCDGRG